MGNHWQKARTGQITSVKMRTTITSTLSTILFLSLSLLFLGPSQTQAFPLTVPTLNGLAPRSIFAGPSSDALDFTKLLEKRKSKSSGKKKKGLSKGVIAAIVVIVVVVIILALIFFFLRRRRAARV
ncbi:MAG: hypothetical protein M1816_006196 [Peltula sp. TS41687]|nr:MAG: hypothetical protein M1816_006196 [Peltula sp. TS41687]